MSRPRVYTPQTLSAGAELRLEDEAARHLLRVLRLGRDAEVHVFDGRGAEYVARLINDRSPLLLRLGHACQPPTESPLRITIAQALAKGERMDYALQKAVELGVTAIQPVISARTVVRLEGERLEKREAHWRGVIIAACEQSGRVRLPELLPTRALRDWLTTGAATRHEAAWVLDPMAGHSLSSLARDRRQVLLLIGPEGGLAPEEIELAQANGFSGVRLGPRVLRTETAATVALSILQSHCGDLA